MSEDVDLAYALSLQEQFNREYDSQKSNQNPIVPSISSNSVPLSVVDESWEVIDPIPDIRQLFLQFNDTYFSGLLGSVEVRWSPRMTLCAGLCCYEGRGGLCSIRLSEPLLKLRPRKDLVQTLLHEMIHALLFVTHNNKDHDAHGPEFLKHMQRINAESGANITVYHNFHDEVDVYRQHWWQCDGPCRKRPPYYGMVRRAMNRAPSPRDPWWADHQRTCGGTYTKIREPENYRAKKSSKSKQEKEKNENEKEPNEKGSVLSGKNKGTLPHFFKRKSRENDKDVKSSSGSGNETVKRRKKDVDNSIVKTDSVESGMGKQKTTSRPGSSRWTADVIPFSGPGRTLGSGPVVDSSDLDVVDLLETTDKTQKEIRRRTKTSEVTMIKTPSTSKHQTSHLPTLTITDAFKRARDSAAMKSSGDITSSPTLGSKGEPIEVLGDSPLSNVLCGSKSNLESLQSNSVVSSKRNSQLHVTHLVSCPVCQTLVRTFEINQHLDTCL